MKTQCILSQTKPALPLSLLVSWFLVVLCMRFATVGLAGVGSGTNNSPSALQPTVNHRPATTDEARSRFARERRPLPSHGLYEDIRAVIVVRSEAAGTARDLQQKLLAAARERDVRVVLTVDQESPRPETWRGLHEGVLFIPGAKTRDGDLWFPDYGSDGKPILDGGLPVKKTAGAGAQPSILLHGVNAGSDENSPSNLVIHILARDFSEPLIREALTDSHYFVADDWLADATSFMFGAVNNEGVFTMGDDARMFGKTRLIAVSPLPARLRLIHNGAVVQETVGTNLTFETKEAGDYRVEALLTVGEVDRPWIYSSAVTLSAPGLAELQRLMALASVSPDVKTAKDISYREGPEEEAAKHKLDIYSPKDKTNAPVLFFIHGGAWRSGDRSQYPPLGNRYASEGYITVVPSYRLAPKHPHPAQIEDVAAAFSWTVRHIAEYGGDTNRLYVGGHSAGGHLAALLTLDKRYLAAHQLSPQVIRGVLTFSGVYNLTSTDGQDSVFGKDPVARRAAAPLSYVQGAGPPFLVTYCQWDYFSLPAQAREFHRALRQAGVDAELVYIPRESHISEMVNVSSKTDQTVAASVRFMK